MRVRRADPPDSCCTTSSVTALTATGSAGSSRVLVLAPTRELAVQIEDEIHGLSYHTTITSAAVYGGVEMGTAGARPQSRRGHHRRHAGPADRPHAPAERRPQRRRAAGARRGRPHDGHGVLARRPANHRRAAGRRARRCSSRRRCPTRSCGSALEIVREPKYVQVGHRSKPPRTHHAPRSGRRAACESSTG